MKLMQTTEGMMQIRGNSFLAKNDARFGLPHPDIIDKYTLNDIKNWLVPNFLNSAIEISIAGDFKAKDIVKLTLKYMGALKQRSKFFNKPVNLVKVNFPKGEKLELAIDSKISTGVIHLAFLTDDFWDIRQTRRLSILSRILSERLRIRIREELGETYSPYAYNAPSISFKDYGVMHAVINAKPERIEFVYSKVKEVIDSFTLDNITQQEVQISLKPVLNHLKIIRKSNAYWLNSVMANSSNFSQKFDWANDMLNDYNKIDYDDMNALVQKYLNIDQSALIIIKSGKNSLKE
jgi:zinc protease